MNLYYIHLGLDGTFRMIAVSPTEFEVKTNAIVLRDVLDVNVAFDRKPYEIIC